MFDLKLYFLCFFSAMIMLFGCGANDEVSESKQNALNVKNTTIENVDKKTGQEISKHLVSLATSIHGVNDATAVVLGKYAIVGIDVNKNLDRSEVGSIKYTVAESLKKDPNGANAIVVADPDINARLREIGEDIQNDRPVQGIINELADIAGRVIPEIPADILDNPTPKNATEEPKKKLNNKEDQNLENKQEEQSNFHK